MHANDNLIRRGAASKITARGETDLTPLSSDLPVVGPKELHAHGGLCVGAFCAGVGAYSLTNPVLWGGISLLFKGIGRPLR